MTRPKISRSQLSADRILLPVGVGMNAFATDSTYQKLGVQDLQDGEGHPLLQVVFADPNSARRIQLIDCSSWLQRPEIGRPFARAFYVWGGGKRAGTRFVFMRGVTHFFIFLKESYRMPGSASVDRLSDLRSAVLDGYAIWIDQKRTRAGRSISVRTKRGLLQNLNDLIKILFQIKEYSVMIDPALRRIGRRPWLNEVPRNSPTPILSINEWVQIEKACLSEIDHVMELMNKGDRLIQEHRNRIPMVPTSRSDYRDLGVCLAAVETEFKGVIPKHEDLVEKNWSLAQAIRYVHSYDDVSELLYPSTRTLVPFVLMLAARTQFNADTVLGLTWSNISESNWLYGEERWDVSAYADEERIKISGAKARSRRQQIRSFPARVTHPTNPPVILRKLRRVTARLRPHAPAFYADRLFIFVRRTSRNRGVTSYGEGVGVLAHDEAWKFSLKMFIRDHGLPAFTLKNLRATGNDLTDEVTGGDLLAQQTILNHRNVDTTYVHYMSSAARQRNNEALARVQAERVRWVLTNGRRDVRGVGPMSTRRAVTAGFECLDPFDSPQPNQQIGKLCDAYLACPCCPLAVVHRRDPEALARLIQFDAALDAARTTVAAQRWIEVLEPLLKTLRQEWLPLFPAKTWEKAKELASGFSIVVE